MAPVPEALALLPGTLAEKLRQWTELPSIPDNWRQLLRPVGLADAIELAELLTPRDVAALGDEEALLLVRAPADTDTQDYWRACAQAIVRRRAMPLPPEAPEHIRSAAQLTEAEVSIRAADIYLWLSQRRPFAGSAPDAAEVREAPAPKPRAKSMPPCSAGIPTRPAAAATAAGLCPPTTASICARPATATPGAPPDRPPRRCFLPLTQHPRSLAQLFGWRSAAPLTEGSRRRPSTSTSPGASSLASRAVARPALARGQGHRAGHACHGIRAA